MKVLKTDNFVSERVKVSPITNAQWKDAEDATKPVEFMKQEEYVKMKNLKDDTFKQIVGLYEQLRNTALPEFKKCANNIHEDYFMLLQGFHFMQEYINDSNEKSKAEVCDNAYENIKNSKKSLDENQKKLIESIKNLANLVKQLDDLVDSSFYKDVNAMSTKVINEYHVWKKRQIIVQ